MKFAITADTHLTTFEKNPERYNALRDIFSQSEELSVDAVVICGDLFDKDFNNYSDFEKLANSFPQLSIWILPGNHDTALSRRSLVGKNIRIFEQPTVLTGDISTLFLPYQRETTMGEVIASQMKHLEPGKWVLFGHGDWLEGQRKPNPYEPGTYMSLTRKDLESYRPVKTFLGHIHDRSDGLVYYPGSPCGLDITETGIRSFLVFDSQTLQLERKPVHTDVIYQIMNLLILPVEDETSYLESMVSKEIDRWNLTDDDLSKVIIRAKVQGYTKDKATLNSNLTRLLGKFVFYKDEQPDLSKVSSTVDLNRIKIAEKVKETIDKLQLSDSTDEPEKDQVMFESLKLIFEG